MIDIIIVAIILVIIVAASFYVHKTKKSGGKCIGCPHNTECAKKGDCTSCDKDK